MVAILSLFVLISGSLAHIEKPSPPPAPTAPETPQWERFRGVIEKVDEAAKAFVVKPRPKRKGDSLAIGVDEKTKMMRDKETISFAALKKGMQVSIKYKKEGDKNIAARIKVATKARSQKTEE